MNRASAAPILRHLTSRTTRTPAKSARLLTFPLHHRSSPIPRLALASAETPRARHTHVSASPVLSTPSLGEEATMDAVAVAAPLPRVTIKFCTQCKWMLRAAYFAQELLSTFSTDLGEVALQPATGGVFTVEIFYAAAPPGAADRGASLRSAVLWDRKTEGGFPEVKQLKRLVRDVIAPGRDLGHVDGKKTPTTPPIATTGAPMVGDVTSTGRGGAEEEVLEHAEMGLEMQPGGARYRGVEEEGGGGEEESGPAKVPGEEGKRKSRQGSVCEECV